MKVVKKLLSWFGHSSKDGKLNASQIKKHSEPDETGEEEFFRFLAQYIAPTLEGIRTKEESNLKQNTASQQREMLKVFQQKFDVMYLNFMLFSDALKEVEEGKWKRLILANILRMDQDESSNSPLILSWRGASESYLRRPIETSSYRHRYCGLSEQEVCD